MNLTNPAILTSLTNLTNLTTRKNLTNFAVLTNLTSPASLMNLMNLKVDLVSASTAVEVFERIRSINDNAGIVSCSRGKLDPSELEGLGAFDRLLR